MFTNNDDIQNVKISLVNNDIDLNLEINQNNGEELSNIGKLLNIDYTRQDLQNMQIEMELLINFEPEFVKYKSVELLTQVSMNAIESYEPNRWAYEKIDSSYKIIVHGYLRDLHINNGCASQDFTAGICEDPHILTFGGNRLDLPHDESVYTMINGLGLRVNVKSQMLGNGSYAKYFYVNYENEEFILDIEDLDIKEKSSRVQTKYHMLKPTTYNGTNFVFEKKMRTLIAKSTDGMMELMFNAETRGLLIKSRLNFTQENSTGIMMSNYVDECKLNELNA